MSSFFGDERSVGADSSSAGGFGGGESDRARSGDLQSFWERWGPGVFALVAIGVALLVAVWIAGGGLRSEDEPASAPSAGGAQSAGGGQSVDDVSSGDGRVGDVVMSGGYEVGADGKLLRPKDAPMPVAPVKPEAMQHETPEGMEAFARYVVELVPYTWMTGDPSKLREISLPDCDWCAHQVKETAERSKDGGWVEQASNEVRSVGTAFEIPGHPGLWNIDIQLHVGQVRAYSKGKLLNQDPYDLRMSYQARFVDGAWKLWAVGEADQ